MALVTKLVITCANRPGGIGKTRLALQVAANLLDHFVDGVYFVSLAPIRDTTLVIPEIAQTLELREAGGAALPGESPRLSTRPAAAAGARQL
jgi:predicted ATPase